jgi:flavin-dependent dehydrogenase
MSTKQTKPVVIVGGGPAGSVAALCLRKLGREAVIYEKEKFPRYRIGESLLPGTMSILARLGVFDRVEAANFTKKRSATFVWGDRAPWSFTFATPKTNPWVFGHAYQVTRAEYDQILLDAARDRGTEVHEQCEVTDADLETNGGVTVNWKNGASSGVTEGDFVIDASGARGVVAQKLGLRSWDKYFRNMAVWSYFKGGKRFKGDLEGNIFSVMFKEGWIWIIPQKDDMYSVGVVTAIENNERIREIGSDAFYWECLRMCPLAMEILETATQVEGVRVLREWSYEAKSLSQGKAFLCGDAACFIDPLFSQGVHLATYSAMLAAASIDYLYDHPEESGAVHAWYERSYREAYHRYHKFVAGFYACGEQEDSKFWPTRKIQGAGDQRFEGKEWFTALTGQNVESGQPGVEELEQGAATLAYLWEHGTKEISDEYSDKELGMRRIVWANKLLKEFQGLSEIRWKTAEARLLTSYRVDPMSFKLEHHSVLGDENGRMLTAFPVTEQHRQLFGSLASQPLSYTKLAAELKAIGGPETPLQMISRLTEEGFLQGYRDGKAVRVQNPLRFGGVGADDDIS